MVVVAGRKNSRLVAFISFFVPGLGQIYVRKTKRGLLIFITVYCLITLDFIWSAISITAHPPHLELSILQRLISIGSLFLGMLFLPFWIYLLFYGFTHRLYDLPLIFTAPVEHITLILLITTLWIYQVLDAYKLSKRS